MIQLEIDFALGSINAQLLINLVICDCPRIHNAACIITRRAKCCVMNTKKLNGYHSHTEASTTEPHPKHNHFCR
ncbi:hypothetical protein GDO81_011844 [Engystomops pustulosus]|uniref:Secreted protein n=1 Tax=Engystomops pustulosus TaxID=76066 RepID=A0AAV7BH75_ENGPU|nr:hypothetical protein GDO81_011844 [Engystomops pustulosus]